MSEFFQNVCLDQGDLRGCNRKKSPSFPPPKKWANSKIVKNVNNKNGDEKIEFSSVIFDLRGPKFWLTNFFSVFFT